MKRLLSLMLVFIICIACCALLSFAQKQFVVDDANLLTSIEKIELQSYLEAKSQQTNMDIVFLSVYGNYDNYVDSKPDSLMAFADDYFDYNGYGIGENYDGVLLVIDKQAREYYVSTSGYGIYVYGDKTLNRLFDELDYYLADADYYGAVKCFADFTYDEYQDAVNGVADDADDSDFPFWIFIIAIIVGVIFGFCKVGSMKSGMHLKPAKDAELYAQDNVSLTKATELFMYSHVTKTRRQSSSSGSGSGSRGGSTHISSSGRSHGGGGRHF